MIDYLSWMTFSLSSIMLMGYHQDVFTVLERMDKESAKDYVLRVMIENIIDCSLQPGEKIEEDELLSALGVSRTPFREAELEMQSRKLLEIRPKRGTYVSLIDIHLVEEVRHLRSVLESELARIACSVFTSDDINVLYENLLLWRMYIERKDERRALRYDKAFHSVFYKAAKLGFWHELSERYAPLFDRTTILSLRVRTTDRIISDHECLIHAIEDRDADRAASIAKRHMERYFENIPDIISAYPDYFSK